MLGCFVIAAIFVLVDSQCQYLDPPYGLRWSFDHSSQRVHFHMIHKAVPDNSWIGVGFGERMDSGLDTILVEVQRGVITVTDGWVQGYYYPRADRSTDVHVERARYAAGVVDVRFSRPIVTDDPTQDAPLNDCQQFKHALVASPIGRMHLKIPQAQYVCNIRRCSRASGIVPQVITRGGNVVRARQPIRGRNGVQQRRLPTTKRVTATTTRAEATTTSRVQFTSADIHISATFRPNTRSSPTTTTDPVTLSPPLCPKPDLDWCVSYIFEILNPKVCSKLTPYVKKHCCTRVAQVGCGDK